MSTGPLWSDYKPPSRDWLEKTMLSSRKLCKAKIEMSHAIVYGMKLDEEYFGKTLMLADEIIGPGKMLDNRYLGQVLHLRDFILQKLMHKRRAVRVVRRWDRRMKQALPKKDE